MNAYFATAVAYAKANPKAAAAVLVAVAALLLLSACGAPVPDFVYNVAEDGAGF